MNSKIQIILTDDQLEELQLQTLLAVKKELHRLPTPKTSHT